MQPEITNWWLAANDLLPQKAEARLPRQTLDAMAEEVDGLARDPDLNTAPTIRLDDARDAVSRAYGAGTTVDTAAFMRAATGRTE